VSKGRPHRRGKAPARSRSKTAKRTRAKAAPRHRHHRPTPRGRALDALTYMRQQKSLTRAAKLAGTTPRTIKRYLWPLLERAPSGRFIAARSDTQARSMRVPTADGVVVLDVRSSRSASRLARYWHAVDAFLRGRGIAALREFRGKAIRVGKIAYPLITDPRTLRRLAYAGEVQFEDLYADTR
jgi:hypothetical protein